MVASCRRGSTEVRATTRWVTACTGLTLFPLLIMAILPNFEDAHEAALLCPVWALVYMVMFVRLRRTGSKAQRSAERFLIFTFPGDSTTPQEMEALMRRSSWCFLIGAVLLLAVPGQYLLFVR